MKTGLLNHFNKVTFGQASWTNTVGLNPPGSQPGSSINLTLFNALPSTTYGLTVDSTGQIATTPLPRLGILSVGSVQLPSSNFATLSQSGTIFRPCLGFARGNIIRADWFVEPLVSYRGGNLTVVLRCAMISLNTGTVQFSAAVERNNSGLSTTADNFGTAATSSATTVAGTAGQLFNVTITVPAANVQSLAAGEPFRIRITRADTTGPNENCNVFGGYVTEA